MKKAPLYFASAAIVFAGSIIAAGLPVQAPPDSAWTSVTVPFEMGHNRMFIEAEFILFDGTGRKARA